MSGSIPDGSIYRELLGAVVSLSCSPMIPGKLRVTPVEDPYRKWIYHEVHFESEDGKMKSICACPHFVLHDGEDLCILPSVDILQSGTRFLVLF
jgi:hypothetical protein